jgi:hypothetical protein
MRRFIAGSIPADSKEIRAGDPMAIVSQQALAAKQIVASAFRNL